MTQFDGLEELKQSLLILLENSNHSLEDGSLSDREIGHCLGVKAVCEVMLGIFNQENYL